MSILRNISFLFRYSWDVYRRIYAAAVTEIILNAAEPFVYLIFPTLIINELTGDREWERVLLYIGVFIGAAALLRALKLLSRVFVNMSVNGCDVKNALYYARHFVVMPYEKLEDEKIRDMQQTVSSKVRVNSFVYETLVGLVSGVIKLIGFSYILTMLHPLALAVLFGLILIRFFLHKRLSKNEYTYQPTLAKYTRRFDYLFRSMTSFDYAKEARINRAADLFRDKFRETLSGFSLKNKKYLSGQLRIQALSVVVSFAQTLLSYGYVAYCAVRNLITVGEFNLYIGAIYNLSDSFNEVVARCIELKYLARYVDDYHAYIRAAMSQDRSKEAEPVPKADENLPMFEFDNVSFVYPNTEKRVLDGISIKIRKGEKLSIVGLNGAGKTTFIKLICRLYQPTEGTIKYYGVDISTIRREEYMKELAVVFQDFRIFSYSFLENIVLGQELDREKVNRAVETAGLSTRVKSLPHGLDTSIYKDFDEEGIEFSGGEGQKLVIARAYYKDAGLVILDEPTAALDAIAEDEIYRNFNEITSGKTAIFISHRLASTRFCDTVAVFANGNIVEYGDHEELMKKKSLYAEMFERQAEYYESEEAER
ncbi:MAG: ABC transporter ATP-binding protein [Clostridia bacterium]|nr:ABC transporter ATP-binding protein [Clostridia bacterium]